MVASRWTIVCAAMLLAGAKLFPAWTEARAGNDGQSQQAAPQAPATDNSVPGDLGPLLAAPQSELRLVTHRYTTDRSTLNGNYDGGRGPGRGGRGSGGGGGSEGRGGRGVDPAGTAVAPLSLSPNRIARLKRFDMSWQAALGKFDANKLSTSAKVDLETLKTTIQTNLTGLDADAVKVAQLMPLVPFAPAIIKLNEARIRMEDVRSQQAAGLLTGADQGHRARQGQVEAGLTGIASGDALKVSKDLATRGADSVDGLRNSVTHLVQLLQRLRSSLHLVDRHALQAGRSGVAGLRRVPARQGRAGRHDRHAECGRWPPFRCRRDEVNEDPICRSSSRCRRTRCATSWCVLSARGGGRGGRGATNSPGGGRPRDLRSSTG